MQRPMLEFMSPALPSAHAYFGHLDDTWPSTRKQGMKPCTTGVKEGLLTD